MIRRKKTTIFTDCKETTTVVELKKIIEGITKVLPEDIMLFNFRNEVSCIKCHTCHNSVSLVYQYLIVLFLQLPQPLDEKKNLQDNGYTAATARAQSPAQVGLVYRQAGELSFI